MNSLLAVEKGLPPGLWLPMPEESTEQYLRENFNRPDHPYERIVDYGSFVVSLAVLGSQETDRSKFMPTEQDITDLYEAGYGLAANGYLRHAYGGLRKLQTALGYYPPGYRPSKEELVKRFEWIKEYAFPLEEGPDAIANTTFNDLVLWGSARNFSPGYRVFYDIIDGNSTDVRRSIGMERQSYRGYSHLDLYRFGAKVIREHGRPIAGTKLDAIYPDEFAGSPNNTIRWFFGSVGRFWMEFDYASQPRTVVGEEMLSLGVRWAIQNDGEILTTGRIEELSKAGRFPSKPTIRSNFGGVGEYRSKVSEAYKQYQNLELALAEQGIDPLVIRLVARLYDNADSFEKLLLDRIDALRKLSTRSESADYVRKLMRDGLDLENELTYNAQAEDLLKSLKGIGLRSKKAMRFVLNIVPRLNPNELLG